MNINDMNDWQESKIIKIDINKIYDKYYWNCAHIYLKTLKNSENYEKLTTGRLL